MGGVAGCGGQIRSSEAAQECFQKALLKEFARLAPILMASHCQLIKVGAHLPGWIDELTWEGLRADLERPTIRQVIDQRAAVIVAIRSFGRIDPRAFVASQGHKNSNLPLSFAPFQSGR